MLQTINQTLSSIWGRMYSAYDVVVTSSVAQRAINSGSECYGWFKGVLGWKPDTLGAVQHLKVAQKAPLSAMVVVGNGTTASAAWKIDAGGQVSYLTADGSYLSVTELRNGSRLPRVKKLLFITSRSLPASAEGDIVLQQALKIVKDCAREEFFREATPAELVQLIDLEHTHWLSTGGAHGLPTTPQPIASLKLTGPGGEKISPADLEQLPVYPSVRERLIWDQRKRLAYDACGPDNDNIRHAIGLAEMCSKRSWMIGWTMSEAEILQYDMIASGEWEGPSIEARLPQMFRDSRGFAQPLAILNAQPLSSRVKVIEKLWNTSPVKGEDWIYYLHEILMDNECNRLLLELSDAELYQWEVIKMVKYD